MAEQYTSKLLHINNFTGEVNNVEELETFIEQLETAQDLLGESISNEVLASIAIMKLAPNSTAYNWFKVEKKKGILKNLNIWVPVEGVDATADAPAVTARPGGLKEALQKEFVIRNDLRAMTKLLAGLQQKSAERIQSFFYAIERKVFLYDEGVYGTDFTKNAAFKEAYERVHDATVFAYLYNGMRPQYRKYCDTQTCTNVAELLKACKDFENGEEGQALLGPNKITTSTMSAMTSNPGIQQSTGSNKISCGYCGINNHGFEDCRRRLRDVGNGIIRDRHPEYPFKTMNQINNEKKKKKKQKEKEEKEAKMSSMATNPPPQPNPSNNLHQQVPANMSSMTGAPNQVFWSPQQFQGYQYAPMAMPTTPPQNYEYFNPNEKY